MRVNNDPFILNQVLNANFNSVPQQLNQVFGYSIQGVITGTPTGTVELQMSDDPNSGNVFPVNWTVITGTSQSIAAAGTFAYNVSDVGYTWVRLVYTDGSSGSSTAIMNAVINIKGF
jgi:hypothetical protein